MTEARSLLPMTKTEETKNTGSRTDAKGDSKSDTSSKDKVAFSSSKDILKKLIKTDDNFNKMVDDWQIILAEIKKWLSHTALLKESPEMLALYKYLMCQYIWTLMYLIDRASLEYKPWLVENLASIIQETDQLQSRFEIPELEPIVNIIISDAIETYKKFQDSSSLSHRVGSYVINFIALPGFDLLSRSIENDEIESQNEIYRESFKMITSETQKVLDLSKEYWSYLSKFESDKNFIRDLLASTRASFIKDVDKALAALLSISSSLPPETVTETEAMLLEMKETLNQEQVDTEKYKDDISDDDLKALLGEEAYQQMIEKISAPEENKESSKLAGKGFSA